MVDGFAVYEVLARDGPGFTLAHCWAHTKRKYDELATNWPTACAGIIALIAAECALRGPVVGRKNHYGSRSLRGTRSRRSSTRSAKPLA